MLASLVLFINDLPRNSIGSPMLTRIIMDTIPQMKMIRILEPMSHPMEINSFSEICSLIVLSPHFSSLKFSRSISLPVVSCIIIALSTFLAGNDKKITQRTTLYRLITAFQETVELRLHDLNGCLITGSFHVESETHICNPPVGSL